MPKIRRRHARLAVALALASSMVAGCGYPDDPTQQTPSRFLIPLTVGNEWTYLLTDSVFGSGVVPSSRPDSAYVERVVRDTVDTFSVRWSVVEARMTGTNALVATTYETITGGGLYRLDPAAKSTALVLPYPVQLNLLLPPDGTADGSLRLVRFDTMVTTPAGSFHCLQYDYLSTPTNAVDPHQTVFISLGLGVVLKVRRVEAAFSANGKLTGHQDRMQILTSVNAH